MNGFGCLDFWNLVHGHQKTVVNALFWTPGLLDLVRGGRVVWWLGDVGSAMVHFSGLVVLRGGIVQFSWCERCGWMHWMDAEDACLMQRWNCNENDSNKR